MMIAVSHFNPVFLQRLTTKVDLSHMVQTSDVVYVLCCSIVFRQDMTAKPHNTNTTYHIHQFRPEPDKTRTR